MAGVILLVFIAVLIAFFLTRGRRKMGFGVTPKHWRTIIFAVMLICVILYAANYGGHR
jgi:cbb3-type cytochrome oxidase subunit 3